MTGHCSICQDSLSSTTINTEEISAVPCGHIFHHRCLSTWMKRSKTCPHCRRDLKADGNILKLFLSQSPDDIAEENTQMIRAQLEDELEQKDTSIFFMKRRLFLAVFDIAEMKGKISALRYTLNQIDVENAQVRLENEKLKKLFAYVMETHESVQEDLKNRLMESQQALEKYKKRIEPKKEQKLLKSFMDFMSLQELKDVTIQKMLEVQKNVLKFKHEDQEKEAKLMALLVNQLVLRQDQIMESMRKPIKGGGPRINHQKQPETICELDSRNKEHINWTLDSQQKNNAVTLNKDSMEGNATRKLFCKNKRGEEVEPVYCSNVLELKPLKSKRQFEDGKNIRSAKKRKL